MDKSFFKDKKVTVFGLGLHGGGAGIVKFLAKQGAKIIVTDLKSKEQLAPTLEQLKEYKDIVYILGQHRTEDFTQADLVVKTPPVPWNNKHVKLALENKIPVEMDSSLFFNLCKNKIIGITGSKGKTTTSTIIHKILKLNGKGSVRVGVGQISVLDRLERLKKETIAVFELSSWRLSALGRIKKSPQIAVFTNIIPDHLNYYSSMDKYIADKKNIFLYQAANDWLVFNADDENLCQIIKEAKSQLIRISLNPIEDGRSVFLEGDFIYLNNGIDSKKVVGLKDIKIKGRHNIYNVMLAIGAAHAAGVALESIRKAIIEFNGVPHRLEFIKEHNKIAYYNDTAATIPEAVISSLNSFAEPVILITGGTDKGLDYADFGRAIMEKAKGVVFLKGNATEKMIDQIRKNLPEGQRDRMFKIMDSMDKAVEEASRVADPGDIILLSPGAASFGLFLNEFDRGDKFKAAVDKLK